MKKLIKRFLSQQTINNYYHLPKAALANIIYGSPARGEARQGRPARGLKVIGVTGTDGKTTTTNMIYQILKAAGKKVSMVSTVNAYIAGKSYETGFHVTSPDPFMIQQFAKKAKDNKDEYLILEVTSHALDQYRFWGIKFDIGVITNITHEHLDYHKNYQNYANTKLGLIKQAGAAVVNQTVKHLKDFRTNGKVITFGINSGDFNQKELKLKLKIPGDYNIENALAALAVAFALGIDRKVAQKALEDFAGITGRMQEVKNTKGINIYIDFAHTPNGLEQALKALCSLIGNGRLIAIIGAEGYRDTGKRVMMGEIARKLADFVIVTAVDPRGQLEAINKQIIEGIEKAGGKKGVNFFVIDSRAQAIDFAIKTLAKKGDTIGVFGKGHEKSMNLDGKKEIPWSDLGAVKRALDGQ